MAAVVHGGVLPVGAGTDHRSAGTLGCLGFDAFIPSVIAFVGGFETFGSTLVATSIVI